jgi:GTP-binding protein EngB required for normal cell division
LQQQDLDMMFTLDRSWIPYQVIFTKKDLVSEVEMHTKLSLLYQIMGQISHSAFFPYVHVVSSHSKEGIDDLKLAIAEIVSQ